MSKAVQTTLFGTVVRLEGFYRQPNNDTERFMNAFALDRAEWSSQRIKEEGDAAWKKLS